MTTTNVTLRIDKSVKEQADELFGSLGMSFTTAVNIFIKKALNTRSIPFEVSVQNDRAENRRLAEALDVLLATRSGSAKGVSALSSESESSYPSITSVSQVEQLLKNRD